MELKAYLHIFLKKWWIIIPTFLITLTSGIVFTYTRVPSYNAITTYVVVPSSAIGNTSSFSYGLDLLASRSEIATTFAEIAVSNQVKKAALDSLSLKTGPDYTISGKLRAGTAIIEISVEGPDPVIVRDLANTIGDTTEKYVKGLYEIFILVALDKATTPYEPTSPNKPLNLTLAAAFGLILGGGLAFLSEYLQAPSKMVSLSVNIIDEETGVYNKEYFSRRLSEEMVRAKRNRYPLSLALMRIDNLALLKGTDSARVRAELLRQVATLTHQYLREEDIIAYLDQDIFALLFPDMSGQSAKALTEYLQTRIAWTPFDSSIGSKFSLKSIVGVTAYNHNGTSRDHFLAQANRALELAEVEDDNNKSFLLIENASLDDKHA
jgi:diguanylate cyclase (GGDEF)-like protein